MDEAEEWMNHIDPKRGSTDDEWYNRQNGKAQTEAMQFIEQAIKQSEDPMFNATSILAVAVVLALLPMSTWGQSITRKWRNSTES
jgi:hypothetical protein